MTTGRYAVMWSGGKDSALAVARAREDGLEIGALLNFIDEATSRVRFHATRTELIAAQARAMGTPLRQFATTWPGYETTFRSALSDLATEGFEGVILGDIHLTDVRAWYEERVRAAGLLHVEPLWGGSPPDLVREFVARGGRAVITCCELEKLDARWLGRVLDDASVEELVAEPIDACGENGEYHSFAFAGPIFREEVGWVAGPQHLEAGFLQLELLAPAEAMRETVRDVITREPGLVAATVARTPKAWGGLAAKAVVAHRERLGRALSEGERRAVWDALWREAHAAEDPAG